MQSFGKSICFSEGCRMTAQYARFGDISILFAGLFLFASLTALAATGLRITRQSIDRLINLILIVALAGEGFFMGYLTFRIHTICIFCVIVFGLLIALSTLRLLTGEKEIIAGFVALAVVFSLQYLILPAGATVNFPANDRLILFYSKDCKHCTEIMKELEDSHMVVTHLAVNEYAGFLKNMGIEHVPTLMVNDQYQKIFLTGKDAISRYLLACTEAKRPGAKTALKRRAGKTAVPDNSTGMTIDIFSQPGLMTSPSLSAAPEGMCEENEICK
ncbi:MAG: vitamin K epoxide reductase family protein [Betaproteobacteria bacterium]